VTLPPRSGWLLAGAAASAALVVLHFGIIVGGAPAYAWFLAPKNLVDLAKAHSLVPTLVTGALAALFTAFAALGWPGPGSTGCRGIGSPSWSSAASTRSAARSSCRRRSWCTS
jgi:hypothetical protein